MKYEKTLAVLAGLTFAGAISQAQIAIGENLTVSGFVDASYTDTDNTASGTDTKGLDVDQVEIDLAFSFEGVSAEVHLQSTGSEVSLEQAFATVDVSGITVSAGRMLGLLGFEADEPTLLNQSSTAYDIGGSGGIYAPRGISQYNDGLRGSTSQGDFGVSVSVYDSLYGGTAGTDSDVAIDGQITYSGIENLSISLGFADDQKVGTADAVIANIFNIHATYVLGQVTLSAEWNDFEDGAGKDGDGYLVLGSYSLNDRTSIAVRYSEVDAGGGATGSEWDLEKFTVSPTYSVTDNLRARLEYSTGEYGGKDVDVFELEALLTF
jgi:hypothetical protein